MRQELAKVSNLFMLNYETSCDPCLLTFIFSSECLDVTCYVFAGGKKDNSEDENNTNTG